MKAKVVRIITCMLVSTTMAVALIGCGAKTEGAGNNTVAVSEAVADASEYKTYEFETFNGDKVIIDSSNIISQEKVDDATNEEIVPADAEVMTPGRAFVLLEDSKYYYVEDVDNNIITIARK